MACPINKVIDILRSDEKLGSRVETLIDNTLRKEQLAVEIKALDTKSVDTAIQTQLKALKKERNSINGKIRTAVKYIAKAKPTKPTKSTTQSSTNSQTNSNLGPIDTILTSGKLAAKVAYVRTELYKGLNIITLNNIDKAIKPLLTFGKITMKSLQINIFDPLKKAVNKNVLKEPHIQNASNFISTIGNSVKRLYNRGIEITPDLVEFAPELAKFLEEHNNKIPEELANTLIYAATQVLASNKESLAGVQDNVDIAETLGLDGEKLSDRDLQSLANKGATNSSIIAAMANVIKTKIQADFDLDTEGLGTIEIEDPNGNIVEIEYNPSEDFALRIAEALAAHIVGELVEQGLLVQELSNLSTRDKTNQIPFLKFNPKYKAYGKVLAEANAAKKLSNEISQVFGEKADFEGFYEAKEDVPKTKEKLKNGQKIGKVFSDTIESIEKTYYEINDGLKGLLKLDAQQLITMFGIDPYAVSPASYIMLGVSEEAIAKAYNLPTNSKFKDLIQAHDSYVKGQVVSEGLAEIAFKGEILGKLSTISSLLQLKDFVDKQIHFGAKVGSNARFYLEGNGVLTPQADKALRSLLNTLNMKQDISTDPASEDLFLFKLDVVSGLPSDLLDSGFKGEDKATPLKTYEQFQKAAMRLKSQTKTRALLNRIMNGTLDASDPKAIAAFTDVKDMQELSALVALETYLQATEQGKASFTTQVTSSSDARNQSVAVRAMKNGSLAEAASHLASVGVLTSYFLEQLKSTLEGTKADLVQSMLDDPTLSDVEVLKDAGIDIPDAYEQVTADFLADLKGTAMLTLLESIFGKLLNADGTVTKEGRNFSKHPVMIHLYGQLEDSLSISLGEAAVEEISKVIVDKLLTKKAKGKNVGNLIDNLNAAINEYISKGNPNDPTKLDLKALLPKINRKARRQFMRLGRAKADSNNTSELLEVTASIVGTLLGSKLFSSLDNTFAPFKVDNEIVTDAYNITFSVGIALNDAILAIKGFTDTLKTPKKVLNKILDITLGEYALKLGSKTMQELLISKTEIDPVSYNEGKDLAVADGGTKLRVKVGNTNVSYRPPKRRPKPTSTSVLPVSTHLVDATIVSKVLKYLKINQVYDAFIASSKTRLVSEILGNIAYFEETINSKHEVESALDAVNKALGLFKSNMSSELTTAFASSFEELSKKYRFDATDVGQLKRNLESLQKELETSLNTINKDKEAKANSIQSISQFGVNAKIIYKDGKITAISYNVGITPTVLKANKAGKLLVDMTTDEVVATVLNEILDNAHKAATVKSIKKSIGKIDEARKEVLNDKSYPNRGEVLKQLDALEGQLTTLTTVEASNRLQGILSNDINGEIDNVAIAPDNYAADLVSDALIKVAKEAQIAKNVKAENKKNRKKPTIESDVNPNDTKEAKEFAEEVAEGKTIVTLDFETNMTEKYAKNETWKNTPNEVFASKGHWDNGEYIEDEKIHIVLAMGEDAVVNDQIRDEEGLDAYNSAQDIQDLIDGAPTNGVIVAKTKDEMLSKLHEFTGNHSILTFKGTDFDVKVGKFNNKHYDLHSIGSKVFREVDKGVYTKGKLAEYHKTFVSDAEVDPNDAHSADYDVRLTYELGTKFAQSINDYNTKGIPIEQAGNISGEFDTDGSINTQEAIKNVEVKAKTELSALNIMNFFSKILGTSTKEGEASFLSNTMTKLVEPFLEHSTEKFIDIVERETDLPFAKGHAETSMTGNIDTLVVDHPRHYNGKDTSAAEAFVHEIIHPITKVLFHSRRVKHFWKKEKQQIDKLYNLAKSKVNDGNYKEWFGDGDIAKEQYEYVFKNPKGNGTKEFVNYALSNFTFGNKLDSELGPISNKLIENIKEGGFVNGILNIMINVLNKVMGRKEKFATDTLMEILLHVNGVNIANKKGAGKIMQKTFDFLKTMDFKMRYARTPGRLGKLQTYAQGWRYLGGEVPGLAEKLQDSTDFRILLADLLPSGTKDVKYVDHKIKTSEIANKREDAIKEVMRKILNPTGKGKNRINNSDDKLLREILVDLDLGALYNIPGIKAETMVEMFNNDSMIEQTEQELLETIENLYAFDATEKAALIADVKDLARGVLHRKLNIGTGTDYIHINAFNIAKLHAYAKTKLASDATIRDLEVQIDALASLYTIQGVPNHIRKGYGEFLSEFTGVGTSILEVASSLQTTRRNTVNEYRERDIKGAYTPVKEDAQYIIPIVNNIHTKIPENYQLVHEITVDPNLTVSYYKVIRSVLQNRIQGAIGTIEYEASTANSALLHLNKTQKVRMIKKIQALNVPNKQESFIFIYDKAGKVKDVALRVPETLEQENLTIDNRASVTLAHAEGRAVESKVTQEMNDEWLEIANTDYQENFLKNKSDFVWVGKNVRDKGLQSHYKILTDRMKANIRKSDLSAGSLEGMWVRKSSLRLNFGGDGKSMVDVLAKYNISNRDINKTIRLTEKGLLQIGKTFKLEIVGKTFDVIRDNIVSNVLLEMLKGRNPVEVIKYTMEGIVEIIKLNEAKKELLGLELKRNQTRTLAESEVLRKDIAKIQKKIDESPVKYLDDLGFNSSFAEDVVDKDSTYMSEFEQKMYDKLDSTPIFRGAKATFDVLYINKGTKLNSALGTLFSVSDFASRYATDQLDQQYFEHDTEIEFEQYFKGRDGYEGYSRRDKNIMYKAFKNKRMVEFQETRWKDLLEQHIDYSLKAGDLLTSLDRLSVLPFFKFKQRIGKVLWKRYRDNPASAMVIGSFLAYLDQAQTFGDFERAEESFFQLLSNTSGSPINHILNIMSPALLDNLGIETVGTDEF